MGKSLAKAFVTANAKNAAAAARTRLDMADPPDVGVGPMLRQVIQEPNVILAAQPRGSRVFCFVFLKNETRNPWILAASRQG
jgi:hypothetical protein